MVASPKPDAPQRRDVTLERTVGSQLILAMNLIMRPFLDEHAKRLDLTLPEWRVLKALAAEPERSGEEVARDLYTDRMSVSRALRRLEDRGRADRRKDPSDRKKNLWSLTEEGWAVFDELAPAATARQEEVLATLTTEEREVFRAALDKVIAALG